MRLPHSRLLLACAALAAGSSLQPLRAARACLRNEAGESIQIVVQGGQAIHRHPIRPGDAIRIEPPVNAPMPWPLQVVPTSGNPQRSALLCFTTFPQEGRDEASLVPCSPGAWLSLVPPAGPGSDPVWAFKGFPGEVAGAGHTGAPARACGHPLLPDSGSGATECGLCYAEQLMAAPLLPPPLESVWTVKPETGVKVEEHRLRPEWQSPPADAYFENVERLERIGQTQAFLALVAGNRPFLASPGGARGHGGGSGESIPLSPQARAALCSGTELVALGRSVLTMADSRLAQTMERQIEVQLSHPSAPTEPSDGEPEPEAPGGPSVPDARQEARLAVLDKLETRLKSLNPKTRGWRKAFLDDLRTMVTRGWTVATAPDQELACRLEKKILKSLHNLAREDRQGEQGEVRLLETVLGRPRPIKGKPRPKGTRLLPVGTGSASHLRVEPSPVSPAQEAQLRLLDRLKAETGPGGFQQKRLDLLDELAVLVRKGWTVATMPDRAWAVALWKRMDSRLETIKRKKAQEQDAEEVELIHEKLGRRSVKRKDPEAPEATEPRPRPPQPVPGEATGPDSIAMVDDGEADKVSAPGPH